jgi:hypothetical protein
VIYYMISALNENLSNRKNKKKTQTAVEKKVQVQITYFIVLIFRIIWKKKSKNILENSETFMSELSQLPEHIINLFNNEIPFGHFCSKVIKNEIIIQLTIKLTFEKSSWYLIFSLLTLYNNFWKPAMLTT